MRNASLATRDESRNPPPEGRLSPLSHPPSRSLPSLAAALLRSLQPLLLFLLVLSRSFFPLSLTLSIASSLLTRSSGYLMRPSPHAPLLPPLHPHLGVRMYVSRGALFVLSSDLPQSLASFLLPSLALSFSPSVSRCSPSLLLLFREISILSSALMSHASTFIRQCSLLSSHMLSLSLFLSLFTHALTRLFLLSLSVCAFMSFR